MIKVVKFGGSSLADARQFKKVADIILSDKARRFVVPSAPGKRSKEDTKVTDLLLMCHAEAKNGGDYASVLAQIKARYEEIERDLDLKTDLSPDFAYITEQLEKGCSVDFMASRGECLNGKLLAEYIGYPFVDAAEVVCFDENGNYDAMATMAKMRPRLKEMECAVVPGFYGANPDGTVRTFSRGGSDVTGSIVAQAVNADLYENWTDVSGFLMCDPRIVENPKPIRLITYRELRELSYMGAGVLHPNAIFPVKEAGIPINIRNTNDPSADGTMIVSHAAEESEDVITGIAGNKGFVIIRIEKDMMNEEVGFGWKVLNVLQQHNISFEHLPSSIDSMTVIIREKELENVEQDVLNGLVESVKPDYICLERGLALIAVVGRGMISTKGTASKVMAAVADADINIRMIDQGSSELNIILGVRENDFEKAVQAIYHSFENQ